jgi:hypothetical protein
MPQCLPVLISFTPEYCDSLWSLFLHTMYLDFTWASWTWISWVNFFVLSLGDTFHERFFWLEKDEFWNFTLFHVLGLWIFLEYDDQWDKSRASHIPFRSIFTMRFKPWHYFYCDIYYCDFYGHWVLIGSWVSGNVKLRKQILWNSFLT